MVCDSNFVCITCRKSYYCGYGSYGRVEERAKIAPQAEHEGHETLIFTSDFNRVDEDGDLCSDFTEPGFEEGGKIVIGYRDFEKIDALEDE